MRKDIEEILEEVEGSMESAALSVVDHIRTVASNGREYATPEAVKDEAEALIQWASVIAKRINIPTTKKGEQLNENQRTTTIRRGA